MTRRLLLVSAGTLLGACKDPAETGATGGGDYRGLAELEAEYVRPDAPEAPPWVLRADAETWEIRVGARWADATVLGAWAVDRDDGLWLDETRMLPAEADEGVAADGCTVTARGEVEVYYGAFPDAVETEVAEGPLAGVHAFAKDVGPIRLTVGGETRELAFYW